MRGRIDARVHFYDLAVLVDYVGDAAVEAEDRNAVGGAVGGCDLLVRIEQQRERQAVLANEILVRVRRVDAASEDDQAGVGVARVAVAERTRLFGASRGFILGIEIKDDFSAVEVGERHRSYLLARYHLSGEWRRDFSFLEKLGTRESWAYRDYDHDCDDCD